MAIEDIISQFNNLKEAIVDSSSVIYMSKAGFFSLVEQNISLITIPEVLEEIGLQDTEIQLASSDDSIAATDKKLIDCALRLNLPIISEDRKILRTALEKRMDYFNSLMMLNFVFYRRQLSEQEYQSYLEKLTAIAWYGNEIWEFGFKLHESLRKRRKE